MEHDIDYLIQQATAIVGTQYIESHYFKTQSTELPDMAPSVAGIYSTAVIPPPSSPSVTSPESCSQSSSTGEGLIQQLSSSLTYLGDLIQDQDFRVSYECHKILKSTSLDCSKIHSDGLK